MRIAHRDCRVGSRGSNGESVLDSAADDPTTKGTKDTKGETDDDESENESRDVDSAPEWSRRGIP
jgi:hypothetical protein